MIYYLFLDFKNAGWFNSNENTKDYVYNINGKSKRINTKKYVEPITVFQISNMLHVLLGERPKPSLRKTDDNYIKEIDIIKNFALNGWIKINPYTYYDNKFEKTSILSEKLKTKKCQWDSTNKQCSIYWKKIEQYLENSLYDEYIGILKQTLNIKNVYQYTVVECLDLISKISNSLIDDFKIKLKKYNKTDMINFIEKGSKTKHKLNDNPRTRLTYIGGITDITRLSGKIIIPIDMWGINKIRNSKGYARLLDGGLVTIENLIAEDMFYDSILNEYTPIKNISTELINIKLNNVTEDENKN